MMKRYVLTALLALGAVAPAAHAADNYATNKEAEDRKSTRLNSSH